MVSLISNCFSKLFVGKRINDELDEYHALNPCDDKNDSNHNHISNQNTTKVVSTNDNINFPSLEKESSKLNKEILQSMINTLYSMKSNNLWQQLILNTDLTLHDNSDIFKYKKESEILIKNNIDLVTVDAVSCFPHTRVKISHQNEDIFVHANFINIPDLNTKLEKIIAIQLPFSKETVENFWLTIYYHNVSIIVNLSQNADNYRQVDHKKIVFPKEYLYYWRAKDTQSFETKDLIISKTITNKTEDQNKNNHNLNDLNDYGIEVENFDLRLKRPNNETVEVESKSVVFIRYPNWTDMEASSSNQALNTLIDIIDKITTTQTTIAVHCRASAGRTGTFLAAWQFRLFCEKIALSKKTNQNQKITSLKDILTLNLITSIITMRSSRYIGMIQNKNQFDQILDTVIDYIENKYHVFNKNSIEDDLPEDYDPYSWQEEAESFIE